MQMLRSPIAALAVIGPDHHIVPNDALTQLFDTPYEVGASLARASPALDALMAVFKRRTGKRSILSHQSPLPDRSKAVAADLHWSLIEDDDGHGVGHLLQFLNVVFADDADRFSLERRQLEQQLEHVEAAASTSDRRYRRILDSAVHFAIVVTDLEGDVTCWNAGAEHVLGWSEAEILGTTAAVFFVPEDRAAGVVDSEMQSSLRNGRASDVRWHLRKSGERFWANGEMTPLLGDDGQTAGFVKILTDQTREHAAQQALRASEDQLRRAQEAGGVGVFTLDIATGRIVVTPAFCRLFGLMEQPVVLAEDLEALVLEEDAGWMSNDARRRDGSALLDVEYRIRRADTGEERTLARRAEYELDVAGTPVRMSGVVQDITTRRAVEQALRESEAQFRILAQAVPNQVWTTDERGRLDWLNERVYEFTGIARTGPVQHQWSDLLHPDDVGLALQRWDQASASGTVFEAEVRVRKSDGEHRWHLARAIAIRGDDGEIHRWVGTSTDIHDQQVALAEQASERERMWTMSQDLMLVCDFDGVIITVNPSATRLLGWSVNDMIGTRVLDYVHPDDVAATEAELTGLAGGQPTLAFENRYRSQSGEYRLLQWRAVPGNNRIHAVGRDITNERSAERNQERIWTLSPVLQLIGTSTGRIQSVNPAWTDTLGWSAQDTTGRPIIEFVAAADMAQARACLARVALGESVHEQELTFTASDGINRPINWTFVAEHGAVYAFGRDLSAQRHTEDALRQSQKMEAVGQLTGGIAHDFNNLLQGITGSLDLMQRRVSQGRLDDLDRLVGGAMSSARRASGLTHRLLAFSRRQPLDPRAVELNSLVRSIEDLLRRTLGERVDLRLDLQPAPWITRCDPNQLESAVLNMVINARDAMPDGGDLSIQTSNRQVSDALWARIQGVTPGEYACLSVIDSGVGMDPKTVARAFEPFFTTKPMGQGTGLGLSMIYGFAKQSGGFASIDSVLGQGTTVTVALPRFIGSADPEESHGALSDVQASEAGAHVLVVEDEVVVRGLIIDVLRELNYTVHEAVDGPAGLALLQSVLPIDLLVTDIGLPGLNGRQIADAGRAVRPSLKVLLMTGYAETASGAAGFLEPGMRMITKPFPMEQFAKLVGEMLNDETGDEVPDR
ncbi:hypothetical protein BH10PSE17_BH10PSE17_25820 [soil metagenome]